MAHGWSSSSRRPSATATPGATRSPASSSATPSSGTPVPDTVVVPAGVLANLEREKDEMDAERGAVARLQVFLRNIPDDATHHTLTYEDVVFLGF